MPERSIKILTDLKDLLVRHFGDEISRVTLFGSRSQDTAQEDSDYDILIVLKHDYDWRKEKQIINTCYEIDLKYDVLTDVKVISLTELQTLKGKQPYIVNALKEGIMV